MFRFLTILREPVQSLTKIIFLLKHSVKLRHFILCGDVAACHGTIKVKKANKAYIKHINPIGVPKLSTFYIVILQQ
jgi:hypothetical protein